MNLAESLKLARYKFVTDRQKYFTELAREAFTSYAKFFSGLAAAILALISSRQKLELGTEIVLYLVQALLLLSTFLAIVASIQIIFCLWRWHGFRKAEIGVNPDSPPVDDWWWVFESLYILAIWGAVGSAYILANQLPLVLQTSAQSGK